LCSWVKVINIVKLPLLSKAINRINAMENVIGIFFYTILQFRYNFRSPRVDKVILGKRIKLEASYFMISEYIINP
jgi:hypothetical protein